MKKIIRYGYFVLITVFGVISLIGLVQPVYGQWSIDPTVNTPISTTYGNQANPQIVGDGSGGAIITWQDDRNYGANPSTGVDIYVQHINNAGQIRWAANGVSLSNATYDQTNPRIISDGDRGAIIAWFDKSNSHIYAQKINDSGQVQWTKNGVPVCLAAFSQPDFQIVSDGLGGAIITWEDSRNFSSTGWDIYVQRISGTGQVLWTTDGVPVDTAAGNQGKPQVISDGSGGAVITWIDYSNSPNDEVHAQHINIFGQAAWASNGVTICTTADDLSNPQITSDGSGGGIITWHDRRNYSATSLDIYAQRINGSGKVQWLAGGVAICTAAGEQNYSQIVSDGVGGGNYNLVG